MAPDNAPPSCPRRVDESSGPRRCGEDTTCPLHLRLFDIRRRRGQPPAAWRQQMQRECDDTCALDVCERAHAAGAQLTLDEIAILLGISDRAVHQLLKNSVRKIRIALRVVNSSG